MCSHPNNIHKKQYTYTSKVNIPLGMVDLEYKANTHETTFSDSSKAMLTIL